MKKRLHYIDIAKGFGMLMILWMHVWGNNKNGFPLPPINNIISSFFVPLFFVLSGYLISLDNIDYKKIFVKKTESLLRPFIVVYILSFFVSYLLNIVGFQLKNGFSWMNIFNCVKSQVFTNGPIWFLLSLFFAFVFFYACLYLSRLKIWSEYSPYVLVLFVLIVSYCGYRCNSFKIIVPMYAGPGITATVFILIGYYLNKIYKAIYDRHILVFLIMLFGLVLLLVFKTNLCMVMNSYNGLYIYFLLSVIGGCLLVISISILFERYLLPIEFIGKYSIIILCFHNYVLMPLSVILSRFIHNSMLWSISCLVISCCVFVIIVPVIARICPSLFNIKKTDAIFKFD